MSITLEALPYAMNALEPFISKETLEFHYGKHHAGYVKKLNDLLEAPNSSFDHPKLTSLLTKNVYESQKAIFNNAAQIWNHSFYWKSMRPAAHPESIPEPLKEQLIKDFGAVDEFKQKFATIAAGHFGSGWTWLVKNQKGSLEIIDTHDAYNPLVESIFTPMLVLDVWEHAYYIDKRNNRPAYISDWLKLINWEFAFENYKLQ